MKGGFLLGLILLLWGGMMLLILAPQIKDMQGRRGMRALGAKFCKFTEFCKKLLIRNMIQ